MLGDEQFLNWTRGWVSPPLRQEDNDLARDVRICQLFLYTLARLTNAQNILEIGVADGSTTMALLKAAEETGGIVHSVDPSPCDHAVELVTALGYMPLWRFYQMKSQFFFQNDGQECGYDLVFIDGDHTVDAVTLDVTKSLEALRVDGYCVLHDWHPASEEVIRQHPLSDEFGVMKGVRTALYRTFHGAISSMAFLPVGPGADNHSEGAFLVLQKKAMK